MPTFSTAPAPCVVSWNTRLRPPLDYMGTSSPSTAPSSLGSSITYIVSWYGRSSLSPYCEWSRSLRPLFPWATIFHELWLISPPTRLRFQGNFFVHPVGIPTTPPSLFLLTLLSRSLSGVRRFRIGEIYEHPGGFQCGDSLTIFPGCHYRRRISKFCSFGEHCMRRLDWGFDLVKFVSCLLYWCVSSPTYQVGGSFSRSSLMVSSQIIIVSCNSLGLFFLY